MRGQRPRRLFAAVGGDGPPVLGSRRDYKGIMASIRTPTRLLTDLLTSGSIVVALTTFPAGSVPLPKPRPQSTPAKPGVTQGAPPAAPQAAARPTRSALAPSELPSAADIAALKEAIAAARRGKTAQSADLQKTISDRVARKLV